MTAERPVRILLVEDDEDDYILTRDLLSEARRDVYHLDWVSNWDEAKEKIRSDEHDVYLLDYQLGSHTGLELLREARDIGTRGPIILLTGQMDREVDLEAMRAGASDYLIKSRLDSALLERSIRYSLEQSRMLDALRESEERYALSALGANDGLWVWDLEDDSVYYSARWKSMLGFEENEIGANLSEWLSRVHDDDLPALKTAIEQHRSGRTPHLENEHRVKTKKGDWRWMLVRGVAIRHQDGAPRRFAGSLTDVTERKLAVERLTWDALHDSLTELPNRALFMDRLSLALRHTRRASHPHLFAVLFLDLDRFKVVNDSLGHVAGDKLLEQVARRLEGNLRGSDTVARFGGDEFTLLLDEIESFTDAVRAAERIQAALRTPFIIDGHEIHTSASIGIALSSTGYEHPHDVLRDADTAMYRAKSAGRARHEIFDVEMHRRALRQLELETALRRAVRRDELSLQFQPIISLSDPGRLVGFEALLRWNWKGRAIPPMEIIPVAEDTGLIVPIGAWVLRQTCETIAQWRPLTVGSPLRVTVNLSPRQFFDPALADTVAALVREFDIRPGELLLEVTESVLIEDARGASELLGKLRDSGVQLALDDFGTGYSSLSSLHLYPFHVIKIDRAFVEAAENDDRSFEIIRGINHLAIALNLDVVVEGIETIPQYRRLAELDLRYAQGFLFSRPVDPEQATRMIREGWNGRVGDPEDSVSRSRA